MAYSEDQFIITYNLLRYTKANKIMQNVFFVLQPFFTRHEYRITVCDGRSQESSTKTTGIFDSGTLIWMGLKEQVYILEVWWIWAEVSGGASH